VKVFVFRILEFASGFRIRERIYEIGIPE